MKLAIINGSPRNKKSNSKILIDNFLSGYSRICRIPFQLIICQQKIKRGKKRKFQKC